MTEEEWLSATAPGLLLWYVDAAAGGRRTYLFAAACLRRIWPLLPGPQSKLVVSLLEQLADREVTFDEVTAAREAVKQEGYAVETGGKRDPSVHAAMAAGEWDPEFIAEEAAEASALAQAGTPDGVSLPEVLAQAGLVRDIFGNPFRPVSFSEEWRTSTAVALAGQMYESRDFSAMPILADALQDAGCDSDDILNHCRDEKATHVRGCWVVDLVLGKS
jgi:hypothetical protein